ncbi:transcription initiation factor TFIID subunit 13, partial [Phenoliferia sp. Uapishka_3]
MMYGFGDDHPAADTVHMMEELVIDHITEICSSAHLISTNRGKIKVDDFKFALRHDPKKLARVDELLFMAEDIARARGKDDMQGFVEEEKERERIAGLSGAVPPPAPIVPPPMPEPEKEKEMPEKKKRDRSGEKGGEGGEKKKKKKKKVVAEEAPVA